MEHPISESSLNRFASGTATREEGKKILAHLLRGCSVCSRKLQALLGPAEPAPVYQNALGGFRKRHLTVR
jgi:hypothetical protein